METINWAPRRIEMEFLDDQSFYIPFFLRSGFGRLKQNWELRVIVDNLGGQRSLLDFSASNHRTSNHCGRLFFLGLNILLLAGRATFGKAKASLHVLLSGKRHGRSYPNDQNNADEVCP